MNKPEKLLFAAVDTGYRIEQYTKFIKDNFADKLRAESLVISQVPQHHYKTRYDYEYNFFGKFFLYRWTQAIINFLRCLFSYDIFHFISGETLLTRKLMRWELMVYKWMGKRVIMHFVGADIRNPAYLHWKEKNILQYLEGKDDFPKSDPWQKELIKNTKQFCDYILVSTPDLLELVPSAHYFPVLLDLAKFQNELDAIVPAKKMPGEIVILHCPTNAIVRTKGTVHIDAVLDQIAAEAKHRIKLVRPYKDKVGTSHAYTASRYELFKMFKEADIVIDQMLIGWYGLLSVEALAAGKEVVCFIDEKLKPYLFPGCPIHIADVNALKKTLLDCIEKYTHGAQVDVSKQQEWLKKYHTIGENHSELLKAWNINLHSKVN